MRPARELHRDYETRSTVDLRKVGAHVYAEHPTTDIILARFAFDDEEPWEWLRGQPCPPAVREHIEAGGLVTGHNAPFEACIDRSIMGPRYGWPIPVLTQLDCTMARSAIQSIPLDLERACIAMGLRDRKDKEGHRLMLRMCKPRGVRKGEDPNGIYWIEDPDSIARLSAYCGSDVKAERSLGRALRPWTESERRIWELDQTINNRGVMIDIEFVRAASDFADRATDTLNDRMKETTGGAVEKATQVDRLKDFARAQGVEFRIDTKTRRNGEEYESEAADREALEDLLAGDLPGDECGSYEPCSVRQAFQIRLDAGKSSTKKLVKFDIQRCADGRARGNLQFRAAGPGRWAGRGIQLQNLIRAGVPAKWGGWDACMHDLRTYPFEVFEMIWGPALDALSKMLRGAVIAAPGNKLYFADFAQVEARGAVWASKQRDMVELFASDGKIYEEMAAFIFGKSVEEVTDGHENGTDKIPRFVGKESVLGCGFGIGVDAFIRNCKKKGKVVLSYDIASRGVYGWREKNWRVVEYWREIEDAARHAIEAPGRTFRAGPYQYRKVGNWLLCRLPSGRLIYYRRPTIEAASKDIEQLDEGETVPRYRHKIHYWSVNSITKQWEKTTTWGGKLLENADQGMCCDLLAGAMLRHEAAGYPVVLSVHDEDIAETPDGFGSVEEFVSIMTNVEDWAKGFPGFNIPMPVKAEGGSGYRYAKG